MSYDRVVAIVERAGAHALERQGNVLAAKKNVNERDDLFAEEKAAFSEVDKEVQHMVLDESHELFPDHGVATEEDTELSMFPHRNELPEGKRTIILDPIDGSWNYLNDRAFWGVSLAIAEGSEIIFGAVRYPSLGVTLVTEKGNGTTINGERVTLRTAEYEPQDPVRIGGSMPGATELRKRFPQAENTRSFITTLLSLIRSNANVLQDKKLPAWKAYAGERTPLHDVGCTPLAWCEAGGAVLGINGKPVNPIASWKRTPECIVITARYVIAPTEAYGRAVLDILNG